MKFRHGKNPSKTFFGSAQYFCLRNFIHHLQSQAGRPVKCKHCPRRKTIPLEPNSNVRQTSIKSKTIMSVSAKKTEKPFKISKLSRKFQPSKTKLASAISTSTTSSRDTNSSRVPVGGAAKTKSNAVKPIIKEDVETAVNHHKPIETNDSSKIDLNPESEKSFAFPESQSDESNILKNLHPLTRCQDLLNPKYLQFTLRITEDIIRSAVVQKEDVRTIIKQHIDANLGVLDEELMLKHVSCLLNDLNLESTDHFDSLYSTNLSSTNPNTSTTISELEDILSPKGFSFMNVQYGKESECVFLQNKSRATFFVPSSPTRTTKKPPLVENAVANAHFFKDIVETIVTNAEELLKENETDIVDENILDDFTSQSSHLEKKVDGLERSTITLSFDITDVNGKTVQSSSSLTEVTIGESSVNNSIGTVANFHPVVLSTVEEITTDIEDSKDLKIEHVNSHISFYTIKPETKSFSKTMCSCPPNSPNRGHISTLDRQSSLEKLIRQIVHETLNERSDLDCKLDKCSDSICQTPNRNCVCTRDSVNRDMFHKIDRQSTNEFMVVYRNSTTPIPMKDVSFQIQTITRFQDSGMNTDPVILYDLEIEELKSQGYLIDIGVNVVRDELGKMSIRLIDNRNNRFSEERRVSISDKIRKYSASNSSIFSPTEMSRRLLEEEEVITETKSHRPPKVSVQEPTKAIEYLQPLIEIKPVQVPSLTAMSNDIQDKPRNVQPFETSSTDIFQRLDAKTSVELTPSIEEQLQKTFKDLERFRQFNTTGKSNSTAFLIPTPVTPTVEKVHTGSGEMKMKQKAAANQNVKK